MQDFKAIFSDKVHEDFHIYKNLEHPNVDWNIERGYFSNKSFNELAANTSNYPLHIHMQLFNVLNLFFKIGTNNEDNSCGMPPKMQLFVHLPSEMPTEYHKSYAITYGSTSTFTITARSQRTDDALRAYPPSVRKCFFQDEKKLDFFKYYSKSHCELECKAKFINKNQKCVPFFMPRNKTMRVCRFSELKKVASSSLHFNREIIYSCGCLQSCNDIKYDVEFSQHQIDSA